MEERLREDKTDFAIAVVDTDSMEPGQFEFK